MSTRRHFLNASLLCAAALAAPYAQAQSYPSKPIRIVVPFGPGGATDVVARTVADKLSARLGQPVIVDNKPGASTMIGADAVAKAAPDGYTLMVSGSSTYTVVPALKERMPYDHQKDLALIALLVKAPAGAGEWPQRTGQEPGRAGGPGQIQTRRAGLCHLRHRLRAASGGGNVGP